MYRDIFATLFVFTEDQKQSKCVAVVEWFNLFGVLFRGIEYGGLKFWAYVCTHVCTFMYTPILEDILFRKKQIKPSYRTVHIVSSLGKFIIYKYLYIYLCKCSDMPIMQTVHLINHGDRWKRTFTYCYELSIFCVSSSGDLYM